MLPASLYLILFATAPASAQEYRSLEGQYAIASKTLLDPPPGETRDRAVFSIQGDGAKAIYESMGIAAARDQCNDDLLTKSAGSLECSMRVAAGAYQCTFAIMLSTGELSVGRVC